MVALALLGLRNHDLSELGGGRLSGTSHRGVRVLETLNRWHELRGHVSRRSSVLLLLRVSIAWRQYHLRLSEHLTLRWHELLRLSEQLALRRDELLWHLAIGCHHHERCLSRRCHI